MDQGFAQCGIQLDSVKCVNRKRKRESKLIDEPKKLYGIVTTNRDWVLMCWENSTFKVLRQAPLFVATVPSGKYDDMKDCLAISWRYNRPKRQKIGWIDPVNATGLKKRKRERAKLLLLYLLVVIFLYVVFKLENNGRTVYTGCSVYAVLMHHIHSTVPKEN